MSFRGRSFRGRPVGNFRRQLFKNYDGPPEKVTLLGKFIHTCLDDLIVKSEIKEVPYFNAPIFTENKMQIGKVDEIFGSASDYYVSVRLSEDFSVKSFIAQQKLFIDSAKLLPLQRFLPGATPRGANQGRRRGMERFDNRNDRTGFARGRVKDNRNTRFTGRSRGGHFNSNQRFRGRSRGRY